MNSHPVLLPHLVEFISSRFIIVPLILYVSLLRKITILIKLHPILQRPLYVLLLGILIEKGLTFLAFFILIVSVLSYMLVLSIHSFLLQLMWHLEQKSILIWYHVLRKLRLTVDSELKHSLKVP